VRTSARIWRGGADEGTRDTWNDCPSATWRDIGQAWQLHRYTLFGLALMEDKLPPFQEIQYVLKGGGEEEYEPHFTVHGFRYVKVDGYPGRPTVEDFCSVAIYSNLPRTGTFTCSDALISLLHIMWNGV